MQTQLSPEQLFQNWIASPHRRDYRDRYQSEDRNIKIFDRALEIAKTDNAILALSHFTIALEEFDGAENWKVIPLKAAHVDDALLRWIQGQSRASLVREILAAGERSELARNFSKACRDYGYQPVVFAPSDVTPEDLADFEAQRSNMSTSEQKRRYVLEGNQKGSFKWFQDRSEQMRLHREEAPR